jgi:hypothetical protein
MRIGVGGLSCECCTFSPLLTTESDFLVFAGNELLERYDFLNDHRGVDFVPLEWARALPGGRIEQRFYEGFKARLIAKLHSAAPLDGLFLHMHGASFVDGMQDAEADLVSAIRAVAGPCCKISASYDLHWGASYLVNDVYKRFIKPEASQRHYVVAAMVAAGFLGVAGMLVTMIMSSIREGWYIVTSISCGVTVIYILRWYWWRINAWSEISAMASALVCTIVFRFGMNIPYPHVLYYVVPITVALSLAVTFLTRPVDEERLKSFYSKIRPKGQGWGPIARQPPRGTRDCPS